ncbi:alanine racemase [Azohydromonas aeria]|uniref:alanine racemase n=1 Tax=Azohydromonas aeria TaxID=2590212 RepID=UPI0012F9E3B3|nr:alanine racemase [Azohydromonas aeria]
MAASLRSAAVLTIDLDAIVANWLELARRVAPGACAAVVKADAYGLGAAQVAAALYRAGCRFFFVALMEEGIALRPVLPADAVIHVLHGPLPGTELDCVEHGLIPVLNAPDQVQRYRALAQRLDRVLPAALQFDTGMARMGLQERELEQLAAQRDGWQGIDVRLAMSHLVSAEEPDNPLNALQLQRFERLRALLPACPASLANSSGIFLGGAYHFNLARPGAALYGVAPVPGRAHPLRSVIRLQARLLQVRDVGEGEGVGYNHTWQAARPSRIATVSVGYADGYLRSLSNRATLRFRGHDLPLVGRVSMDTVTVDVSRVPANALQPGTFFDLIDEVQDINALAAQAGTNAYEILTQLGHRYERRHLGSSAGNLA